MTDLVIIGAGPAGLTAAIYAARRNLTFRIFEAGEPGGYMLKAGTIENYPGFPEAQSGAELASRMKKQAEKFKAKIEKKNVSAIQKDENGFLVITQDGEAVECSTVLIATGAQYRRLNIKNEEKFIGHGLSYCSTCDGPLFRGKTIAVVGGGDKPVESALYLEGIAKKVYLVQKKTEQATDKELAARLEKSKIEKLWDHMVVEVKGGAKLESAVFKELKTGKEKEIALDGLFLEIGAMPGTELTKGCGIKTDADGYIIVNHKQETSCPGVYAAGDVTGRVKQISVAVGDAAVAVISAKEYLKK